MNKVLFVCTGNTCRSPMAQGIFNKLAKEKSLDYIAESAGIATLTGLPVSENSKFVCKEFGIDISHMRSTDINDVDLSEYEVIYAISQSHKDALVELGVNGDIVKILGEENGEIYDPYGGSVEVYRACRDEIYDGVNNAIKELCL